MTDNWTMSDIEELTDNLSQLAEIFGGSVSELLEGCLNSTKEVAPELSEPCIMAATINGGLIGILQFMAAMSSQGRLPDPNGQLTKLFHLAARTWDGIRTSSVEEGSTLQ